MVGLNDAGSFLVAYSNYETFQKNVERRLSRQMAKNDSLLWPCRSIIQAAEVSPGFGTVWKQNEVKTSFDLRQ